MALLGAALALLGFFHLDTGFGDPGALKWPLMAAGLAAIAWSSRAELRLDAGLAPAGLFLLYSYARLTPFHTQNETALALGLAGLAFLLAYGRAQPLARPPIILSALVPCLARGAWDLLTWDNWGGGAPGTLTAFFVHKNIFAFLLGPALVYQVSLLSNRRNTRGAKAALGASCLATGALLLLSDSRGAQAGAMAGLGVWWWLGRRDDRGGQGPARGRWLWLAAAGAVAMACLAWLPEDHFARWLEPFLPSRDPPFRLWAWKAGWRTFLQAPWLGHGTGDFVYAVIPNQEAWKESTADPFMLMTHAHNHFLETAADRGVVGLALELLLVAGALFGLRKGAREGKDGAVPALAALSAILVHAFFAEASEYTAPVFVYWSLLGYGWSYLVPPRTPRPWAPRAGAAGMAMLSLLLLAHGWGFARELRADRLYQRAQAVAHADPAAYAELASRALALDPGHPEAAYALAVNLAQRGQWTKALGQLEYMDALNPNQKMPGILRSRIHLAMGRIDSARFESGGVLRQFPFYMPALEVALKGAIEDGDCAAADSLRRRIRGQALPKYFLVIPPSAWPDTLRAYFARDPRIHGIQRRLGDGRLYRAYQAPLLAAWRANYEASQLGRALLRLPCPDPKASPGNPGPAPALPPSAGLR